MKGLSKRVAVGFLSVVALLVASGMISLFELRTLSNDTELILSASHSDITLAKDLLRSVNNHNQAIMRTAVFNEVGHESKCRDALDAMDLSIAAKRASLPEGSDGCFDTLVIYVHNLRSVTDEFLMALAESKAQQQTLAGFDIQHPTMIPIVENKELSHSKWYETMYTSSYQRLTRQIERYIDMSHGNFEPRIEQLNKNAYRSVAPVFISLLVVIAIVLMLFYFINKLGVRPILAMNKSLSDYITFRLPYRVKEELIDELKEVNDNISTIITSTKSAKH